MTNKFFRDDELGNNQESYLSRNALTQEYEEASLEFRNILHQIECNQRYTNVSSANLDPLKNLICTYVETYHYNIIHKDLLSFLMDTRSYTSKERLSSKIDDFSTAISFVMTNMNHDQDSSINTRLFLLKLNQHVNLILQYVFFMDRFVEKAKKDVSLSVEKTQKKSLEKHSNEINEIGHGVLSQVETKLAAMTERQNDELSKQERNMSSKTVGFLAAFTALAFLIFGNLLSIDKALNINKDNFEEAILSFSLWGFTCFNLIFLFLFFVRYLMYHNSVEQSKKRDCPYCLYIWVCVVNVIFISAICLSSYHVLKDSDPSLPEQMQHEQQISKDIIDSQSDKSTVSSRPQTNKTNP